MLCWNFTWLRVSHPRILGNSLELAESPLNALMGRSEPVCLLGVLLKPFLQEQHGQENQTMLKRAWWSLKWLYLVGKGYNSISFSKSCLSTITINCLQRRKIKRGLYLACSHTWDHCFLVVLLWLRECGLLWFNIHHVYFFLIGPLHLFSKFVWVTL